MLKLRPSILQACLTVCLLVRATSGFSQATYQWNGVTSTNWTTAANWLSSSIMPTGVTNLARLNINGAINPASYISSLGYTVITNGASGVRALVIGSGSGVSGTLVIAGGTLETIGANDDVVGNSGGTAILTIAGGTYINTNKAGSQTLDVPLNGPGGGTLTINSGQATVNRILMGQSGSSAAHGLISLNGGTLTVSNITSLNSAVHSSNNFNGGILQAAANGTIISSAIQQLNVLAGGAIIDSQAFAISIAPVMSNGVAGIDGGLTKNGSGSLTLLQPATYTGPTIVNNGTLGISLPITSQSLTMAAGTTFNVTGTNSATWTLPILAITNSTLGFNYGSYAGNTTAMLTLGSLQLFGTNVINISGSSIPVTTVTLINYSSKIGVGSLVLGTLPAGVQATLVDTGSSIQLNITSPSVQNLIWSGGDGIWQTNGAADWNSGASIYTEYPALGYGDQVTFNDTGSGTVNIPGIVKPFSTIVTVTSSFYTFSGGGSINGSGTLTKSGTSILTIANSNGFSGGTTVSGGTLEVINGGGLGVGGTTVRSGATLEVGAGTAVSNQTVTISGTGLGALGALQGADSSANVWAGPVIIGANGASIGTQNGGFFAVSGPITSGANAFSTLLRTGIGGTLVISNPSNSFTSTVFYGDQSATGQLILGANNVIPVGEFDIGPGTVDMSGNNQQVTGLGEDLGAGTLLNNGGNDSTLTLVGSGSYLYRGPITDGNAGHTINLVMSGTGTQTLGYQNTYSGGTTVNSGTLAVSLPMNSGSLTIGANANLSVAVSNSSWSPAVMNAANAILNLNYGAITTTPGTVFNAGTLNMTGSSVINITGTGIPVGNMTIISYSAKTGSGSFHLGTVPNNIVATIVDTGSAIVLNVTVSPQLLTWSGSATGSWNTNGSADWTGGNGMYQEYANNIGDAVIFNDNASVFSVNLASIVHPSSVTVNNSANAYTISGPGQISGPNGITMQSTNVLTLGSPNSYTGITSVQAGTVSFANGGLGSGGNIILGNVTTLQWAPGNSQDVSSRLRIGTGVSASTGTMLDTGTNNIVFNSGLNQNTTNGEISTEFYKIGAGNLTLASGTSQFGSIVRINAGTLTVSSNASVLLDGTGTVANAAMAVDNANLTINGGTVNILDRLVVATAGNSIATATQNGGILNIEIGSSTATRGLRLVGGTTAENNNTGTFNLNGGIFTVARVYVGVGTANTSIFNFNGGTIRPSANFFASAFLQGLTHAFVRTNGAIIDTFGDSLTIGQPLEHDTTVVTDGGLVKLGAGVLTLSGANTYNGPTIINAGSLQITGSLGNSAVTNNTGILTGTGTIAGPVTVLSGGTLSPGVVNALNQPLTVNNSVSLAGTTVVPIGLVSGVPSSDSVVASNVTYGGTLVVTNISPYTLTTGQVYQLFTVSGSVSGNFSNASHVTVLPASLNLTGTFNPATGQLTTAAGSSVPTTPTNITAVVTGNQFSLSWPSNYVGWTLQSNAIPGVLSTNWVNVPNSSTTNQVIFTINPAVPVAFFRLKYTLP